MEATLEVPSVKIETKTRLAQANGHFYNSLFDTYLSKSNGQNKNEQVAQLIEKLPQHAKGLYTKGVQLFQEELKANHALLEEHRGEEAKYLLSCVMNEEGKSKEEIDEVLKLIAQGKANYIEPTAGLAIIQVDRDLFSHLKTTKVITSKEASAVSLTSDTGENPSFMIVQIEKGKKTLDEEETSTQENKSVRHEFHHFLWNFLKRGEFLRTSNETTPELSKAFNYFRSEVIAYIIEGRSLIEIHPEALIYSSDKDLLSLADKTKNFAQVCFEIAHKKGVDPSLFLYPTMTSRNFSELKENLLELTPIEKSIQLDTVSKIYDVWKERGLSLESSVKDVLRKKGVIIPTDIMHEFAIKRLQDIKYRGEFPALRDFQNVLDELIRFSSPEVLSTNHLLAETLSGKLPFSDKIIKEILDMPRKISEDIPIINDPSKFIETFISLWGMKEERRAINSLLINATPEMRQAFDKLKDEIIARDEKGIRNEFNYDGADEAKKERIDADIKKRIDLLRTL